MLSDREWQQRIKTLVGSSAPAEIDQAQEELQRDRRELQQRIAALEVRAEREREAMRLMLAYAVCEPGTCAACDNIREIMTPALAAEPDARPLLAVRQTLVHLRDDLARWEAGTRCPSNYRAQIEDCGNALAVMEGLGVSDA